MDICLQILWQRVQGFVQRAGPDAGHQAGARRHRPSGNHQGDIHHATVRQSVHRQVLWQLLQEHRSMGKRAVIITHQIWWQHDRVVMTLDKNLPP